LNARVAAPRSDCVWTYASAIQCLSIIDISNPSLQVIQRFQAGQRVMPLIPLGKRGKLHGDLYEVIGFQCREINVDGAIYQWREYVLFNPYKGFRYLTEYDGHWNDVKSINGVPEQTTQAGKRAMKYLNEVYTHFQTSSASTTLSWANFHGRCASATRWCVKISSRHHACSLPSGTIRK
jgi:hypothetical protein